MRAALAFGDTGIDCYRAAAATRRNLGTALPIRARWDGPLDVKGAALALTFGADEIAGPMAPPKQRYKLAQLGGPPEDGGRPSPAFVESLIQAAGRFPAQETSMSAFLDEIRAKVDGGTRLSFDDGVRLMKEHDVGALGALANRVRERRHGDRTYFNVNMHLNATNVCVADCHFCSFARLQEGMPGAYTMTVEEAVGKVRARPADMTEIHIVNGLHPGLPFSLLRGAACARSSASGRTCTSRASPPSRSHYYAEHYGMTITEVLERLVAAGLGSLPGGGAEVFAERVRRKICADKVDADGWLAIHRVAHKMGLRSNCTLLYGHIETVEERVDHLVRLRALQDETGGFQTFIPLAFHNENNALEKLPGPTGVDDLRLFAVARLMLDNIPHVKAYWAMLGVKAAQIALVVRRRRRRRHRRGREDLQDGRLARARRADALGAGAAHPRRRPHRRSSATRCTTSSPKVRRSTRCCRSSSASRWRCSRERVIERSCGWRRRRSSTRGRSSRGSSPSRRPTSSCSSARRRRARAGWPSASATWRSCRWRRCARQGDLVAVPGVCIGARAARSARCCWCRTCRRTS